MNYYLYKISFITPLHCGRGESAKSLERSRASICADTLFSALCCEAAADGGAQAVSDLCEGAKRGDVLFSDLFPYHGDDIYIPKPALLPRTFGEALEADRKKAMKSLEYIPLLRLEEYIDSMEGRSLFEPEGIFKNFAETEIVEKVSLKGLEKSNPYFVTTSVFNRGCGLHGLIACGDEKKLKTVKRLLRLLGMGGIGGKVSAGYGKFKIADEYDLTYEEDAYDEQTKRLWHMLTTEKTQAYLSLTTSLPSDEELGEAMEGSLTTLRRRGGFVASESYGVSRKKDTQYFLGAGSLFRKKYAGTLYNVARGGAHPVYRYSKPIFLGVDYQ